MWYVFPFAFWRNPRLIRAAKLPTCWSRREFGLFFLSTCAFVDIFFYRGIGFGIGVVASVILFKRMSHEFRMYPIDQRVPSVTRTNMASRPFHRIWCWYCLRGLRPVVQPRQDTWHPSSSGFRPTQAIKRRLLSSEAMALIIWHGHDFVLERRRDHHHNIFQNYSLRPLNASPCCLTAVVASPLRLARLV